MGVLIEHHGGAFPTWLAPVQAQVIPIAEGHLEYAKDVGTKLENVGVRAHIDLRNERMNAKIRDAQLQKVPYMLIVGDREIEAGAASVRLRSGENIGSKPIEEILKLIMAESDDRT